MAKVNIPSIEEFKKMVGQEIGVSDWQDCTQERINMFAEATEDYQFIHIDPERAQKESPYGRTIAHGFFTLSLFPGLRDEILGIADKRVTVNYGIDKMRFPAALPVGERVRMHMSLLSAEDIKGGLQVVLKATFEVSNQEKPACVAEVVNRFMY